MWQQQGARAENRNRHSQNERFVKLEDPWRSLPVHISLINPHFSCLVIHLIWEYPFLTASNMDQYWVRISLWCVHSFVKVKSLPSGRWSQHFSALRNGQRLDIPAIRKVVAERSAIPAGFAALLLWLRGFGSLPCDVSGKWPIHHWGCLVYHAYHIY
jgi:hypothetical protein